MQRLREWAVKSNTDTPTTVGGRWSEGLRREGRETWLAGVRLRAPDGRGSRAAAEARTRQPAGEARRRHADLGPPTMPSRHHEIEATAKISCRAEIGPGVAMSDRGEEG